MSRAARALERITDDGGRYLLPSLRIGTYLLTVELAGFRRLARERLVVQLGQELELDSVLDVGGPTEEVRVSGETPLLQAASAEISDVIDNSRVVEIPLNGRSFLSLAQLSDAVVLPPGGTSGDALEQAGPLPTSAATLRPQHLSARRRQGHRRVFNNLVINPSVDSIQEFKIQKSQYPAEFGGKASALINVATRAGGNRFRGGAFEFFRDDRFDARNYFDAADRPKPPLRQNQFGGTAGGPIVADRAFFFASYEGQRINRSLTRTFTVPSAAMRGGDFSGAPALCDPSSPLAAAACVPFPDNRIPSAQLDPVAGGLLQQVPLPTSDAAIQNLTSVAAQVKDVDQISVRVDQRMRAGDQLFARFSTFDADEVQPFGTSVLQETLLPGFGRTLDTRTRNIGVSYTHIFSRSVVHETRAGWMRTSGGQRSENRGVDFAQRVGLQGVTRDPRDVGYPQVSTRGLYSAFGDATSFVLRNNEHFEVYDNLTVDCGAHRLKLGAYYFHLRFRPEQPDNARGAFTFTGQFSGNAFADFLLGYPATAVSGIGRGDENGRTNWLHAYLQDDWRPRANLTVNLGLRYEYNQHMRAVDNRLSSVDYETPGGRFVVASDDAGGVSPEAQALLPLIPIPWVPSSEAGWNRGLLSPSKVRLAPRTGFAWSLAGDRAVLRGGYGVFLNQWAYSVQTAFARNLPFFYTNQIDVPASQRVPAFHTADILTADPTGVVAPTIMDHRYAVEYTQTWSGGLQYELVPATVLERATWARGRSAPTMPRCTTCRSPDRARSSRAAPFHSSARSVRSASTASPSITRSP